MKALFSFFLDTLRLIVRLCFLTFRALKLFVSWLFRKKRRAYPLYALGAFVFYIVLIIYFSGDSEFDQRLTDKRVNDVTQLNPIQVSREIRPTEVKEIAQAIRTTTGPISIGGGRYSMGGQTAFENSLHIDMRSFDQILNIDTDKKQITVQPGITWRKIQEAIDEHDLSVKIMQTYANFTVGGAISVNCHGRYIGHGPIISSVMSIKLLTASGELIVADRDTNSSVFKAAIGGYGGIGVIVEATLQLEDNDKVERWTKKLDASDYNTFFDSEIRSNEDVVFQNGDLYPPNYDEVMSVAWVKSDKELTEEERLTPEKDSYWFEQAAMRIVSLGDFGKWARRKADPIVYASEKVVWRNNEASYNVMELEPKSREKSTYVLQEYFIPVGNIKAFIPKMRKVFDRNNVNMINVSLRHAYPDHESYLSWAPEEVFAFVVYYKQGTDEEAKLAAKKWTIEMTDMILSEGGSWYLPYQPHATVDQFQQAYKNADAYFEIKDSLDHEHRFTNKLLDKYNPFRKDPLRSIKETIPGYQRAEEQTVLTVPEWYLVFNPKEYSDFLEAGNNPSEFPFYASIDEYWKLYDRSIKLCEDAYPENAEYITMLQIIGVSVTLEYGLKLIYENTIGRVFSWFSEPQMSPEEQTIIEAQRAYSDFIYHTAWYEFGFWPWVKKVWAVDEENQGSTLRKYERTLFFTLEFAFKASYAQLLEVAAKSAYEEPVTTIYLRVNSSDPIEETEHLKIIAENGNEKLIGITRWGAFTETIKEISNQEIEVQEIGGNDEIVISVIGPPTARMLGFEHTKLYTSEVVTSQNHIRSVYLLPVKELLPFVQKVQASEIELEHVFDY